MGEGPGRGEGRPPGIVRRPGRRAASRAARLRRASPEGRPAAAPPASGIRLNKLLASRGLGARRKCDLLIAAGSVRVNGTVVKEPGLRVMPERDRVEVHGRPIPGPATLRYLMVHKPVGTITTLDDPEGRPTMRALLPASPRLFPVGRLDAETSGLIIATNDGALAHHLMHPRYGVRKVYRARLDRPPDAEQIRRLREGVEFEPRIVSAPCLVRVRSARADRPEIEIVLHEGRYRQVRRMCEAVGLKVVRLHRPTYGPLTLGELPRGAARELTPDEVRRLRAASARPVAASAPRGRPTLARPPGGPTPQGRASRATIRAQSPRSTRRAPGSGRGRPPRRPGSGAAPGPRSGQRAGRGGLAGPRAMRRAPSSARGATARRAPKGKGRPGGRSATY